jgi:Tol biopolymer transport system component
MRLARLPRPPFRPPLRAGLLGSAALLLLPTASLAFAPGSTTLISAAPGGAPFPEPAVQATLGGQGAVSDDGRFVLLTARGTGLLPGAPAQGAYLKDLVNGTVTLVSRTPGVPGTPLTDAAAIGIDDTATRAAFLTSAQLSPGDTNTTPDVYIRNLETGATALATTTPAGTAVGEIEPGTAMLAGAGRFLAFATRIDAAPGDGNGVSDVYVKDLQTGAVALASQQPATGTAMTGFAPSISDDGARVAFLSLGSGGGYDTNGLSDAYVFDRLTTTLELASRQNGAGGGASTTGATTRAVLSGDGGTVAFVATGSDYSDGGNAGAVHRRILGTTVTQLASRADGPSGAAANLGSTEISINDGGSVIAFRTAASNLDGVAEPSGTVKAFVRRVVAGETERVSVRDDGTPFTGVGELVLAGHGQHVAMKRSGDDGTLGAASDLDVRTDQVVLRDLSLAGRRTRSVSRPAGDASQVPPLRKVIGRPDLSENGRYVAFVADAPAYLPAGASPRIGVFRRDLVTGTVAFVSVAPDGTALTGNTASSPSISADGARIAFAIGTTGFAGVNTGSFGSIYVRDVEAGTTVVVDSAPNDTTSFGTSGTPVISADGRRVAFRTRARLVSQDGLNTESIYLRELATLRTMIVSRSPATQVSDPRGPYAPAIDADGSRVAFTSDWSDYGDGAPGGRSDIHVADMESGQMFLASSTAAGASVPGDSYEPKLDAAGLRVAFTTDGKLAAGDADAYDDAVVKDLATGAVEALGMISGQGKAADDTTLVDLSADGRRALVLSRAALDPAAPTASDNLFLRDRDAATTTLVSRADGPTGAALNDDIDQASLDATGTCVAFLTDASPLTSPLGDGRAYLRAARGSCPVPAPADASAPGQSAQGAAATPALRLTGLTTTPRRPRSGRPFTVRFSLSGAARVRVRIERTLPGRLRKGRCTTAARAPRGKRCERLRLAGTLPAAELAAGAQQLRSTGRFGRKRLPAGRYRVTVVATPSSGAPATATVSLTVLRAAR